MQIEKYETLTETHFPFVYFLKTKQITKANLLVLSPPKQIYINKNNKNKVRRELNTLKRSYLPWLKAVYVQKPKDAKKGCWPSLLAALRRTTGSGSKRRLYMREVARVLVESILFVFA